MSPKQIKDMITWLRKERIAFTSLTAGSFSLDGIIDMKASSQSKPDKPEPRQSMFEQYGAELLRQPPMPVDDVPDEAKVD